MGDRQIEVAPFSLRAHVRADSIDPAARTVELVFSTGAAVQRYDWRTDQLYLETLSMKPADVRLDRLNAGAPFLNTHSGYSLDDILGVVVDGSAHVRSGRGVATVRISSRADVEPIWRDIQ